jgi:methionyl-tRNA formyltransferase
LLFALAKVSKVKNQPFCDPFMKIWQAEVVETGGQPGSVLSADKTGIMVGCGQSALRILELQRDGGKRPPAGAFLAGFPL